jgi:hypothetical protein
MRKSRLLLGGGLLALLLSTTQSSLAQPSNEELQKLRDDMQSIKEGQKAIMNELQEMKKQLTSRGEERSPVRDINAVLAMGDAPFKGDKQATLTLVEYTDFQ